MARVSNPFPIDVDFCALFVYLLFRSLRRINSVYDFKSVELFNSFDCCANRNGENQYAVRVFVFVFALGLVLHLLANICLCDARKKKEKVPK